MVLWISLGQHNSLELVRLYWYTHYLLCRYENTTHADLEGTFLSLAGGGRIFMPFYEPSDHECLF